VHLPFDDGSCPKPRLTHAVVSPARQFADEQTAAPPAGWRPAVVQFVLEYEAYLGRVLWRGESLPGLRESLVDELTFQPAHTLLRERGEDMALRHCQVQWAVLGSNQ
jgi:hypothetical protein